MPNDVITLLAVAKELDSLLRQGRIEKVYQPENDEITLQIKVYKKAYTLVISANPSHPRIHISTQKKENAYSAPAFCMLLRKYLVGSYINNVDIFNNDRIIRIETISQNELKDVTKTYIIAELMGRYSNIILVDENMKIIDAIKRIHFDQSTTRYILPKLPYTFQPQTRITFDQIDEIKKFLSSQIGSKDDLIKNIGGISKETASEIFSSGDRFAKFADLLNINSSPNFSPCLRYENGSLKDYYITEYSSVPGDYVRYPSMNEALDDFYKFYDGNERKKASTKTLTSVLKRLQQKTERRIADNEKKLSDAEQMEKFRVYGELIISNIYAVKHGDDSLQCENYYDGTQVTIPLDPLLSPSENAQEYYKKYAKLKRAQEIASEQLRAMLEQREYLKTIEVSIENCSLKSEYDEIMNELNGLSGIKNNKKKSYVKEKPSAPQKIIVDGFEVYFGKNNLQNNEVTFTIGKGGDTWLHVKNQAGSHVIIKGTPTDEIIFKCAQLAAFYSSAKSAEKVEVDYTLRKYVKKIPNALPGMVTYTNYKSILVSPADLK